MNSKQKLLRRDLFSMSLLRERVALFENDKEFDVIMMGSDGNELRAHRIVLSMSSKFFYSILLEVPAESVPTIHIPDLNSSILELILLLIYTGEAILSFEVMDSFTEACEFLQIECFSSNKFSIRNIKAEEGDAAKERDENEMTEGADSEIPIVLLEDVEQTAEDSYEFAIEYLEMDDNNEQYLEQDCDATNSDTEFAPCEDVSQEVLSEGTTENAGTQQENKKVKRKLRQTIKRMKSSTVESVLSEISKGKTINQLSIEHNLPRSTLYHRFRKNENLKRNYRSERRSALEQAVRSVMEERMSLKKASDRFHLPKTAIWRELRKYTQYKPPEREVPQERVEAQNEIISGKSLTSISSKYGIPLTTLHRDKKRLSLEGKLPESYRCKDGKEKSEFNQRIEQALQKCRQGMSQYQAAKMYNIPKATMWRYAHACLKNDPGKIADESEELQIEVSEGWL